MSTADEVVAKMKNLLVPLFQENQDYVLNDVNVTEAAAGFKVSGTATIFQINSVQLVATFSSADIMGRFDLILPDGSKLPNDVQQKLAKQNITNWIPGEIQKLVSLKSLYLELAENTISTVGIHFAAQQNWIPVSGISANNIVVDFNLNNPLTAVSISSTLKSNLILGDATIQVGATVEGYLCYSLRRVSVGFVRIVFNPCRVISTTVMIVMPNNVTTKIHHGMLMR